MTIEHSLPQSGLAQDPQRAARPPATARLALAVMERLAYGSLTVTLPDGSQRRFGRGEPHAELHLANWGLCSAALNEGDIGFGESYVAGDWSTPDLAALFDVMVANRQAIEAVIYGRWWGRILNRVRHLLRRNSRRGSRRNIPAHYDLGNDFYSLWLDPSMTYSSALFPRPSQGVADDERILPQAQEAKYARLLDALDLPPGGRLLEIGCGWGGLAEKAQARGLEVTAVTLSPSQLEYAQQRVAGRSPAADLRLMDYRDLTGVYDGVASIEMFEAVGEEYWGSYFRKLASSLKPAGRAVVQTIVIADDLFESYRKSSDFIQKYIFPGGMLPSRQRFEEEAAKAGLAVEAAFHFGADYARTLAVWLARFERAREAIQSHGFDVTFMRTWSFYLAYCQAAFKHANTDVVQFTLVRAR